ncbi:alpha/beta hydrolase [Streptomyces sp. LHD-70]|uniref:alpha/beta hydrolase n=1 Tax=Streptomyces sp. LHD-70 TaxID=3072140 RepID=UPI00280CD431|nr:alpha/beta hydrolase [Streptomyces sp. LHD-70]MDQ8700923.1 alpha/beta hydrolase [Streptomyces sp. LHD-70]
MSDFFNRLLKQDFSDLKAAGRSWQKVSEEMGTAFDDHRTRVTGPLHAEWNGDDAETALRYLEDIETRMQVAQTETMAIAKVIETTVQRMEQAQKDLRAAVTDAEAANLQIGDDGAVQFRDKWAGTDQDSVWGDDAYWDRANAEAEVNAFQRRIDQAINDAAAASDEARKALAELDGEILDRKNSNMAGESAKDVDSVMDRLGVRDPQVPKDPKDAAKWWRDLSPEQQQEYVTLYPERIGTTAGLPSDVRNDANRLRLEQDLDRLQQGDASTVPGNDERRRNLETLKAELDRRDGASANKQLYLLNHDAGGDGKSVIAMGNPDTADNVGVQVPGTTNTMDDTRANLARISRLQNSADDADSDATTSMVYWLGYDAPEMPGAEAANLDVAGPGRAEDAGPELRDFTHGLRASHEGERANLTVLGHSYGSTVVGAAASEGGGLDADNIVAVGSPGMLVDEAEDLNVDPDHVYYGLAPDDLVAGPVQGLTLGRGPTHPDFGGTQFETDTSGHSGYWDLDPDTGKPSESLSNQGRIIAGRQPTEHERP